MIKFVQELKNKFYSICDVDKQHIYKKYSYDSCVGRWANELKLVLNAYTNKQLTNISDVRECPLTMANIDELLMSIQSYKNIYVPKFRNI